MIPFHACARAGHVVEEYRLSSEPVLCAPIYVMHKRLLSVFDLRLMLSQQVGRHATWTLTSLTKDAQYHGASLQHVDMHSNRVRDCPLSVMATTAEHLQPRDSASLATVSSLS